jgi:hypothetical protein
MNKKYIKYIEYIVSDIQKPYFHNMRDNYGLTPDEYELVLSKVFKQSVTIKDNHRVYDTNGNLIYREYSDGTWIKKEYDSNDNEIYYEDSDGYWIKSEYDDNGNEIYQEDSNGDWYKKEYDTNGSNIYYETSDGVIVDNR